MSYETELYVVNSAVQIVQTDGARIIFNRAPRNRNLFGGGKVSRDGTAHIFKRAVLMVVEKKMEVTP